MYDTFEGLEKFATFIPEPDNSFLELVEHKMRDTTTLSKHQGTLASSEISTWLRGEEVRSKHHVTSSDVSQRASSRPEIDASTWSRSTEASKSDVAWTFRLLCGSSAMRSVDCLRHFPFSKAVFKEIETAFEMPSAFLGLSAAQTPMSCQFRTSEHCSGILTVLTRRALVVTHNPETRNTRALVIGLCPHEATKLFSEMRRATCLNTSVIEVSLAWLNVIAETRARRLVERKLAMTSLELEADMHRSDNRMNRPLESIDLQTVTRKLTTFLTQIAFDEVAIEHTSRFGGKLQALQSEYIRDYCQSGRLDESRFKLAFEQTEELLYALRKSTKQIKDRAHVTLQTMYSLVAQRDNELNFTVAKNSEKLAKTNQEYSASMAQLAQDSKEVALRTYKDSISMRLMAIVNLCTMPGTFTATFFSTSFFDFKPSQPGSIVSSWVWLYWAVTIALTTLIVAPLFYFTRKTTQRLDQPGALERPSIDDSDEPRTSLHRIISRRYPATTTQTTTAVQVVQNQEAKVDRPAQTAVVTTVVQQQVTGLAPTATQRPRVANDQAVEVQNLPEGSELGEASFGELLDGPLEVEEGSLFHTPGLRFERSCRVCAYPSISSVGTAREESLQMDHR